MSAADFATYDGVLQLGVPPQRIALINKVTGLGFDEASEDVGTFELEGRLVRVIGLRALVSNKRATGRLQDLADAKKLEELHSL